MKTITNQQRLQLIGLLTLAEKHSKALDEIHAAALDITKEEDPSGHTSDAVYEPSRRDADNLIQRLNIEVK